MASKEVIVDSGLCTYDIKDKEGRLLGQFTFNPSDTDIVKRHEKVVSAFEKMEIPDMNGENLAKGLEKIDSFIYEQINYLLDSKEVAESFFSIMGPLSPLASGQFFVESVLDAIGQAIQMETGERVKKISGKIRKHTSKYHG
jgi:hypothetical protein